MGGQGMGGYIISDLEEEHMIGGHMIRERGT